MKDIINSFKAHLYERTSSPLLGSFIFYWIICNYKLIMVIFDDEMKLNEKFDFIKTIYPQEKITLWNGFDIYYQILLGNGLLIPLIITLIYILLLPFASNFIYGLWIKHQNNFKKISNEKVLTKKEFGDLQRRFTELELSFDDTFSKKDNEIVNLKGLIESKESRLLESDKIRNSLENTIERRNEEINTLNNVVVENYELRNQIEIHKSLLITPPKLTEEEENILKKIYFLKITTINNLSINLHKSASSLRNILNKLIYDELLKVDEIGKDKDSLRVCLTKLGVLTIKSFTDEEEKIPF